MENTRTDKERRLAGWLTVTAEDMATVIAGMFPSAARRGLAVDDGNRLMAIPLDHGADTEFRRLAYQYAAGVNNGVPTRRETSLLLGAWAGITVAAAGLRGIDVSLHPGFSDLLALANGAWRIPFEAGQPEPPEDEEPQILVPMPLLPLPASLGAIGQPAAVEPFHLVAATGRSDVFARRDGTVAIQVPGCRDARMLVTVPVAGSIHERLDTGSTMLPPGRGVRTGEGIGPDGEAWLCFRLLPPAPDLTDDLGWPAGFPR